MVKRIPRVLQNTTSLVGATLAGIMLTLILFLTLVEQFSRVTHPYMGIITFVILPIFLNMGILLVIYGAVHTQRKMRRIGAPEKTLINLDFSTPRHRRMLVGLMIGSFIFLMASAFGSYQAYEYTDSVEFCGEVCHAVMKPEYTAYKTSPHARVACVQCHIGPGTSWFVRSKISGSYQVYSVLFHKYHRPIGTPIQDLRPAKETCEQCHWPAQFYSEKMQTKSYFLSDEANTRKDLKILLKIGGGNEHQGVTQGIHYSMYLTHDISYVALDKDRSVIPYVESKAKDGTVTVYKSTDTPITPEQIAKGEKRKVDCIECHNRPSHVYRHPAQSVNQAIAAGEIDAGLPEIKKTTVDALEKPYKTEPEALAGIRQNMIDYFKKDHSAIAASKGPQIEAAIKQAQSIYSHNFFPEMNTDWKKFPDHIGHMYSPGCFRCHDGKHVSDKGKVITNDCNTCHTILSQTAAAGKQETSLAGLAFRHPLEMGDAWKSMKCSDCHAPKQ